MLDQSYVDDVVHVEEADTIRACHRLAGTGFLFGGSTGTVISGAMTGCHCMARKISPRLLSPQTSASAISTPSTTPTGSTTCTARTCSAPIS